jgi:hypothetical protein
MYIEAYIRSFIYLTSYVFTNAKCTTGSWEISYQNDVTLIDLILTMFATAQPKAIRRIILILD